MLLDFLSLDGSSVLAGLYLRHIDHPFPIPCLASPSLITGFILGQLNAPCYLYYREMALQFPWCPQKDSWATWMIGQILRWSAYLGEFDVENLIFQLINEQYKERIMFYTTYMNHLYYLCEHTVRKELMRLTAPIPILTYFVLALRVRPCSHTYIT